jgi:hypothetical protein
MLTAAEKRVSDSGENFWLDRMAMPRLIVTFHASAASWAFSFFSFLLSFFTLAFLPFFSFLDLFSLAFLIYTPYTLHTPHYAQAGAAMATARRHTAAKHRQPRLLRHAPLPLGRARKART